MAVSVMGRRLCSLCTFVVLCFGISCGDEKGTTDRLIGSWYGPLSKPGIHITLSFTVKVSGDDYKLTAATANFYRTPYTTPPSDDLEFEISVKDRAPDGSQFREIALEGQDGATLVVFVLKDVEIVKNSGGWVTPGGIPIEKSLSYIMTVAEVEIQKEDSDDIRLLDQVFIKTK